MTATARPSHKSGRPRDETLRLKILKNAYDLAIQQGYRHTSLQQIAAAAHVGRPTIYRWWSDKTALFLDVIKEEFETRRMAIDATRADSFRQYIAATCDIGSGPFGSLCIEVLIDVSNHPDEHADMYRTYIIDSRKRIQALLENLAKMQGKQFVVSIDVVTDMIIGIMWYRQIHKNLPLDRSMVDEICRATEALLV